MKLRKENRPFFIEQLYYELANVPLGLHEKDFPCSLVGAHGVHAEILLCEILLGTRRTICSPIMQGIGTGKPAKLPVPDSWVSSLELGGIHVTRLGCKISLFKFSTFSALKGIAKAVLLLLQYKLPALTGKPYVVFLDLSSNNVPVPGREKSYDIISWYRESRIKKPEVEEIWAEVRKSNIHEMPHATSIHEKIFPRFGRVANYIHYLYKSCKAIAVSFAGIIRGKWWYGPLLEESVLLHYISVVRDQDLAKEYFFHNSAMFRKPLWTYEAAMKGSRVTLYYYSTNIENFQWDYRRENSGLLKTMQWRNIVVWDRHQRDFLQRYCPKGDYQVVGSIDFSDSPVTFESNVIGFKIAVFDVTPTRPVFYTGYAWAIAPYWSEKLSIQFFCDIGEICDHNKVHLLWKQKRIVDHTFISKAFIGNRARIINKYFSPVHPDVSARRLIEESDAVISMPFTSTAIIGKELGKPSIYYDASGSIATRNSHGIPVLKNRDELTNWLDSLNISIA